MKKDNNIDKIRKEIDTLDKELLKLLSERGAKAKKIGKIKEGKGKKIYVPSRERQIFNRLSQSNKGPYNERAIRSIFREIISATRALERPISVAFLGPEATFTHQAATGHFGHAADFIPQADISMIFNEVEKGEIDFGVVPIENSTEGVVSYTLDKFVDSDLKICSEIIVSVDLHLISVCSKISDVKTLYSHPQALAQCRNWLARHLPHVSLKNVDSTASAAKVLSKNKNAAAIASDLAANFYGLNILARKIQDSKKNFTRFLVLGKEQAGKTGNDKTSIAFVAKDKPGILFHLLKPLANAKINLTKIESRPLKTKAWEYMFFVDLDGHSSEKRVQKALEGLEKECMRFKVLGSYPKA